MRLLALFVQLQEPRTHHRRERKRHQQRDKNGDRHCPAEGVHILAGVAGHERNGQEDDDERERGRHNGQADFPRSLNRGLHAVQSLFLHEAENIFEDDDRVINDDPDRQRQRQQRHVVQGEVHPAHQGEAGNDRGGNRNRRDQHRPPVADENPNHHTRQNAAQDQVLQKRVHGGADEIRNVVNHQQLNARRQLPAQLLNLFSDIVGHADRVCARLTQDLHADHILPGLAAAKQRRPGAEFLSAIFDLRNVADANRNAGAGSHYNFAELIRRGDAAKSAQSQLLRSGNHAAARRLNVLALERLAHVEHGKVVGGEFLRVEQNADLACLPAV